MRYIVRPDYINWTPKNLAQHLGMQTRRWPRQHNWGQFDFQQDFFMAYPHNGKVNTTDREGYHDLLHFWNSGKYLQRSQLHEAGIQVPPTMGINFDADLPTLPGKYIARPILHHAGSDYKVIDDISDVHDGEYLSRVFPKDAEWRILYVLGEPLLTIEKYISVYHELEEPSIQPWTDANHCMWRTVSHTRNPLRQTNVYDKLAELPIIKRSHIVGVDIMTCGPIWVVTEFNACPTLKVSNHLEKVVNYVQANF